MSTHFLWSSNWKWFRTTTTTTTASVAEVEEEENDKVKTDKICRKSCEQAKGQSAAHCQGKKDYVKHMYCMGGWIFTPTLLRQSHVYTSPGKLIRLSIGWSGPSLTWSRDELSHRFQFSDTNSMAIVPTLKLRNMTFEVIFMWNLLMLPGGPKRWGFFTTIVCPVCVCVWCVRMCVRLFVCCDCLQNSCHLKRSRDKDHQKATEYQKKTPLKISNLLMDDNLRFKWFARALSGQKGTKRHPFKIKLIPSESDDDVHC